MLECTLIDTVTSALINLGAFRMSSTKINNPRKQYAPCEPQEDSAIHVRSTITQNFLPSSLFFIPHHFNNGLTCKPKLEGNNQ